MHSSVVKKADCYIAIQQGGENEWLARFRQGDEAIFREVYETNKVAIYSYSLKLLNYNVSEAEDMTALAFVRLWENRECLESYAHIRSFLYMVARNAITNHFIRHKRRIDVFRKVKVESELTEESAIDFEVAYAEMISHLMEEIEGLPGRIRDVFKMLFFDKKSGKEIALALGISEASVTREKQAAREILRTALLKRGMVAMIFSFVFIFTMS